MKRWLPDLLRASAWGVVASVALPEFSWAQPLVASGAPDFASLIRNFAQNQLSVIPYLLNVICYIMGIFMVLSGALKLKAHVENPTSEKMAPGVSRLVMGGVITAIPIVTTVIQKSVLMQTPGSSNGFTPPLTFRF